ncbi:hypothetical protein [Natrarchaeobaculum aegyptiacum]|uniref:Nitroreductase n=1 Tax=Natrarchaeobaculum aegyptiacum TaxID=745377 RepID=A0A2Z2HWY3_9EURY|nr:hypothetical protein [Natrarchaeobaculum aegyptiacum]ARS90137.1 hypothetical protein B1756_10620 [Natrarchaeobaculum aegyptiacum]
MATAGANVLVRSAMWIERRLVNPIVDRILRSRLHPLLSGRLAVLSYEGRVSGERFSTPVLYERDGETIAVTTGRRAVTWWKNFRNPHPATLWIGGEPIETTGQAITDADAIAAWTDELTHRSRLWRLLFEGGRVIGDSSASPEERARAFVVVRFEPVSG